MKTNYEKLNELLENNKDLVEEIDTLFQKYQSKQNYLLDQISELSLTFTQEDDAHDDLLESLADIAARYGLECNAYDSEWGNDWEIGDKVEFWEPSTC